MDVRILGRLPSTPTAPCPGPLLSPALTGGGGSTRVPLFWSKSGGVWEGRRV